ncbi:hypothetical protein BXZ70DRAFT_659992 [Cristinia sonorae]|uniref:Uncharacterized protein n=1 Tax=Cristinia sonorae TaxID=1940300 RepID=A0A8K0UEV5_9AGAR|nr:hypothetical protein BXZ70DRAFT_659992 [Cristinia sonorae]
MSTAIEQAIAYLIQSQQPLTVSNVVPIYLAYAGLSSTAKADPLTAMIAFERAMDKHPMPPLRLTTQNIQPTLQTASNSPPPLKRLYHAEVEKLRRDYWAKANGGNGATTCTCRNCGRRLSDVNEDPLSLHTDPAPTQRKKGTTVQKRKKKRLARPAHDADPYGASTSAQCL